MFVGTSGFCQVWDRTIGFSLKLWGPTERRRLTMRSPVKVDRPGELFDQSRQADLQSLSLTAALGGNEFLR